MIFEFLNARKENVRCLNLILISPAASVVASSISRHVRADLFSALAVRCSACGCLAESDVVNGASSLWRRGGGSSCRSFWEAMAIHQSGGASESRDIRQCLAWLIHRFSVGPCSSYLSVSVEAGASGVSPFSLMTKTDSESLIIPSITC